MEEVQHTPTASEGGSSDYLVGHVLLLDDSTIDNFINVKALNSNGFSREVTVFKRSVKAFRHLQTLIQEGDPSKFPDLIFLDLRMPEMSGPEFLSKFKSLPEKFTANCRIVILSNFINEKISRDLISEYKHVIKCVEKPLIHSNLNEIRKLI